MKTRPFRTAGIVAVTILSLLLSSCATENSLASENSPTTSQADAAEHDGFVGQNDEAIALGTTEHIVVGSVASMTEIPNSYGRYSLTLRVAEIHWQADARWNIGEQQRVPPLLVGDEIRVAVDGAWSVSPGDEITVAINSVPFDAYDGYVRVVLGTDIWRDVPAIGADVGGGLGPDATRRFVATAAELRGVDLDAAADRSPQTKLLTELVLAARGWIDEVNRADRGIAEPPFKGLLADVYSVLAGGQPNEGAVDGVMPDDSLSEIPAELRQLSAHPDDLERLETDLGVELEPIEAAVFDATGSYTYFALRFVDVGIVGPWNSDQELSYARLRGIAPVTGDVELLGWTDAEPAPTSAAVLGRVRLPDNWTPSTHALVLAVSKAGDVTYDAIEQIDLVQRIDALLQTRTTG